MLLENNIAPSLISPLSSAAKLIRILASVYGLLCVFRLSRRSRIAVLFPLLMCAGMLLSCLVHSQVALSNVSTPIQYAGMSGLLANYYEQDKDRLKRSLRLAIVSMAVIGLISIYIQKGFITGDTASGTIYTFGGKNSLFDTFVPVLLIVVLFSCKSVSWFPFAIGLIMVWVAASVQSSGSAICFALASFAFIPKGKTKYLFQIVNPKLIVVVILVLFGGTIVTTSITSSFDWLFSLVGRESNFTNRDILWNEAIAAFLHDPLFGSGPNLIYSMSFMTGILETNIAHCFPLDMCAKYGLIAAVPLALDLGFIAYSGSKECNKENTVVQCAVILALLMFFHCMYDNLLLYYFAIVRLYAVLPSNFHEPQSNCKELNQ